MVATASVCNDRWNGEAPLPIVPRRQPFKLLQGGTATSERSVVVITGRCQRLNPGSSPGARTTASHSGLFFFSMFMG